MDEKMINTLLELNYQKGVYEGLMKAITMLQEEQNAKEELPANEDRGNREPDSDKQKSEN